MRVLAPQTVRVRMAPQAPTTPPEALTAVVAHGLLTSMSVVSAGIQTVQDRWSELLPSEREHLLDRALAHAAYVSEGLKAMSKGLTEGAVVELDSSRPRRSS